MFKNILCLYLLLIAPLSMAGNNSNVTLPAGQIRVQGEIVAETCEVEASVVHMGQVSSYRFSGVGDDADPVPFSLHLRDCKPSVSDHVRVVFRGVADSQNSDVLSIGEGNGIASGVGIALFDEEGQLIPLMPIDLEPQDWKHLTEGENDLQFIAKYRATKDRVIGGAANAQAWFSLIYQ